MRGMQVALGRHFLESVDEPQSLSLLKTHSDRTVVVQPSRVCDAPRRKAVGGCCLCGGLLSRKSGFRKPAKHGVKGPLSFLSSARFSSVIVLVSLGCAGGLDFDRSWFRQVALGTTDPYLLSKKVKVMH